MKRLFALIAVLGFHAVALAAPEDELLEPDKAFALSTQVLDASTLRPPGRLPRAITSIATNSNLSRSIRPSR